jgi:glycosyltransferase involved in cell wall biosynthesis
MSNILASAPLVIGMPVYNGASYITGAIDALLRQSFRDFVLFISDNCSMDDTGRICQEFAERDSRVVYFRHDANRGVIANFKFVLERSSSEFFMWAADDDRWSPHHVERCIAALRSDERIGLAMSNVDIVQHTNDGVVSAGHVVVLPSMSDRTTKNVLIRFMDFTANLIYGVFRRRALEDAFREIDLFDLFDVYVVNTVALHWKVFIISDFSFLGGLRRSEADMHRPLSPERLHYGPFVRRSIATLFRQLPGHKAALLSAVLLGRLGIYETERRLSRRTSKAGAALAAQETRAQDKPEARLP